MYLYFFVRFSRNIRILFVYIKHEHLHFFFTIYRNISFCNSTLECWDPKYSIYTTFSPMCTAIFKIFFPFCEFLLRFSTTKTEMLPMTVYLQSTHLIELKKYHALYFRAFSVQFHFGVVVVVIELWNGVTVYLEQTIQFIFSFCFFV